jgi:hypothetical protein
MIKEYGKRGNYNRDNKGIREKEGTTTGMIKEYGKKREL